MQELTKIEKIKKLVKQPSTIRGLVILAGLIGYSVKPEEINAIIGGIAMLLSVLEILRDEDKGKE